MKDTNSKPLVSVIIPVYNGEKHIAQTLNSIIEQDYENFEIILVNDASTDNTLNTAEKILSNSKHVFKIINHEKNYGVSKSRNDGIEASNGVYLWFCDGDDLAEKNFISYMCSKAENEKADIVFCNYANYFEDENRYEYEISAPANSMSGQKYLEFWNIKRKFFYTVWNCILRKSFIEKNNLYFFSKCRLGEDTEFIMKAIVWASRISFIQDILYIYIHHSSQSTAIYNAINRKQEMFHNLMLARIRTVRYIIRHTNNKKIKSYALNFYIPDAIVKELTFFAQLKDFEGYKKMTRILRHKKIREMLLSTVKFIFRKPELFFKSLMLVCTPKLYYFLRKDIKK